MKRTATLFLLLLVLAAASLPAESIRILAPYLGVAGNSYENPDYFVSSEDTSLMEGLFFQWVDTERFLVNVFLYHSAEVNYSALLGGHLIGDVYFWANPLGRAVAGAGLEVIRLDMDAGAAFGPVVTEFELPTTFIIPYLRAGHTFLFGSRDRVQLSVFPWAGAELDITRGEVSFTLDVPGPPPPTAFTQSIDDEDFYAIAGLNLSATILHFIDLQAKYKATFNADDLLHGFDGLANVFLSRHWGLSYRFKYLENPRGSTSYHLGGVVFVF